jgi:mRNA interferase RelE/StbE
VSLVYKIILSDEAKKSLRKLDKSIVARLLTKFESDLRKLTDPRQAGKALKGELGSLWRYRVGDYRIICDIQDEILTIIVVRIGHRKNIYD